MRQTNTFLNSCWWNYLNLGSEKQIDYLSPIAGDLPGWYLWLKKRKGVYEFILTGLKFQGSIEISSFAIKYYPHYDELIFDSFATAEQVVRLSPYFDDGEIKHETREGEGCACAQLHHTNRHSHRTKGFPRFKAREKINPTLFTIGEIQLFFDKDSERILKSSLISQDKLMEYSQDGIFLEQKGEIVEVIKPGQVDRSIPAWELCWDLYDLLVKEIFAKIGVYPRDCQRNSEQGFIFYQEKGGDIWSKQNKHVTQITQIHLY